MIKITVNYVDCQKPFEIIFSDPYIEDQQEFVDWFKNHSYFDWNTPYDRYDLLSSYYYKNEDLCRQYLIFFSNFYIYDTYLPDIKDWDFNAVTVEIV